MCASTFIYYIINILVYSVLFVYMLVLSIFSCTWLCLEYFCWLCCHSCQTFNAKIIDSLEVSEKPLKILHLGHTDNLYTLKTLSISWTLVRTSLIKALSCPHSSEVLCKVIKRAIYLNHSCLVF